MARWSGLLCLVGLVLAAGAASWAAWSGWFSVPPYFAFLLATLTLAASLAILSRCWRVFPRRRLAWLALVPAVVSLGLPVTELLFPLVLLLDALAGAVVLFDLCTLPLAGALSVERTTGRVASLRKPHRVQLLVSNHARRVVQLALKDGVPGELHPEPAQFVISLAPRSRATLHYDLKSDRRGAFSLATVHLRARSRWGFWQRLFDLPAASTLHVYPDMKQLEEYALLARTNRLSLLGVRRTRRIGQDNEFERLRDYTPDDNYKQIDWRATARRRKLTVKDYQANQSQRVIFLVDCGRMMTNLASGISLLDHALNAMLMLSYVALERGDSVGLICFSDEVHSYVPARGGRQQMNRLLHACFDRFPRLVESRYDQAFLYLGAQCRKRSLVILLTNLIDEVNAHQVERYLASTVGRHLPLGVLLRDHHLFDAAEPLPPAVPGAVPQPASLYRAAAAADIITWRHQVLSDLHTRGVLSLDVFPEDLTAPLINRYLDIKARHLL